MNKLKLLVSKLTFFSAILLIVFLFLSISFGVYFLGDTVTHLQFATMGGPLTTFIQHHPLWPPFFSLLLNIGMRIPINSYLLVSIFTGLTLFFYITITFILLKLINKKATKSLVVIALTLLGPITLVMQSFITEPLFIALWMSVLFFTVKFWNTSEEKWLIGWLIFASLLPFTRYIGVVITGWFILVLFIKLILDLKKKTNYSKLFLFICFGIVWIPISYYLLRTKVQIGTPLSERDLAIGVSFAELGFRYMKTILSDIGFFTAIAFIFGITKKEKINISLGKIVSILSLGSAVVYIVSLLLSELSYFVTPYIPSRYLAVSYPFIILGFFVFGRVITNYKKTKFKYNDQVSLTTKILISVLLILGSKGILNRLQQEKTSNDSTVSEISWTGDLKQLCDNSKQQYLIAHIHSRNWTAWSYSYLCDGILTLKGPGPGFTTFNVNSTVISAYEIKTETLIEKERVVVNGYTTYFYDVTTSTAINLNKIFNERDKFE
jgi:hypothetical protein